MKRKNEKGNESSRLLLLSFTHVFVRTLVVPSTVPFRTPGTVPNAVRKISPRSSGRTERAAEIESITSEAARLFLRRFIWARHSSVLQTRKETSYFSCVSRYFSRLFFNCNCFFFSQYLKLARTLGALLEIDSLPGCRSMAHLPVEERERLELDRTKVIWVSIPA